MDTRTAQALIRFGLGRRGEQAPPGDPAGWLAGQVRGPDPARLDPAPNAADGLRALRADRQDKPAPGDRQVPKLFRAEATALVGVALTTDAPFRERLVRFWANHFAIAIRQGGCAAVAGAFVQEAIRPHVTGRFGDMLLAVMRHPAMLMYLENAGSVGPDSLAGQRSHRGLNENLARECMELHTLSPASGYTQADVTAFANVITGWSVDMQEPSPGFLFRPNAHEPGAKTIMGRSFPPGEQGGVLALAFFAQHPATHRFLATKLARHFVADEPPADAVRRIEGVLRDTGGDLGQASLALIGLPAAWQPLAKLRQPQDFVIATLRTLDLPADKRPDALAIMRGLGQPLFDPPLPNGWSDRAADWAAPEAMMRRVDWSYGVAGREGRADPMALADASLGPLLHASTLDAMRHAGSRRDALTLLLASPEFQRR